MPMHLTPQFPDGPSLYHPQVIYHHHAAHDWGSIVHHGMFTAMTHYVLHGWFFKKP